MRRGRCGAFSGPAPVRTGRGQAAFTARPVPRGRCGAMICPSGSSSPVSSKRRTPLHSRLQPCSGWCAVRRAASRSAESAVGHGGWCWHMEGFFRCVVVNVLRLDEVFMAAPRIDRSGPSVAPRASIRRDFAAALLLTPMTRHPAGRFTATALSLRVVRGGRTGLVRMGTECAPQHCAPPPGAWVLMIVATPDVRVGDDKQDQHCRGTP